MFVCKIGAYLSQSLSRCFTLKVNYSQINLGIFFLQMVATQIEEIQSRRLPEPPPDDATLKRRSRNEVDDEDPYVRVDNDDRGSVSSKFQRRMNIDDCTDVDGYLKPTFHQFSTDSDLIFRTDSTPPVDPIPAESYASPPNVARNFSSSTQGPEKSSTRCQCYKTFYGRKLRLFIIS